MGKVRMTWPMCKRQEVEIDGVVRKLGPVCFAITQALLLRSPDRPLDVDEIAQLIYSYGGPEAYRDRIRCVHLYRLRQYGLPIRGEFDRGYSIPAECRGTYKQPLALAA